MPVSNRELPLTKQYELLRKRFGFLDWWPGETKLEIVVGAILTQNTSWTNVEKAISNLKKEDALELRKLATMQSGKLQRLIRPSGFYRQKAKRLKYILSYVAANYGTLENLFGKNKTELRKELLGLSGIGNETADSIVLYAAEKPTFVIDAYTRRIMHRVYGMAEAIEYLKLQRHITDRIPEELELYKDFHAQFVMLAKNHCRKKPLCEDCPLERNCRQLIM